MRNSITTLLREEMISRLPSLARLQAAIGSKLEDNFFARFEDRLASTEVTFNFYRCMDEWLAAIPETQWPVFQEKAAQVVSKRDLKRFRHWESLHDVFFEAFGFRILINNLGCETAEYITDSITRAPDFSGMKGGVRYLLEAKKINPSQAETEMWYGGKDIQDVNSSFAKLKGQIQSVYENAIDQHQKFGFASEDQPHVLIVVDPDITAGNSPAERQERIGAMFEEVEDLRFPIHYVIIPH